MILPDAVTLYALAGDAADALYRQTLADMQKKLGAGNRYTLELYMHLAEGERREGRFRDEAADALQAFTGRGNLYGANSPDTLMSQADLALAYLSENRYSQAETEARAAFDGLGKALPGSWQQSWAELLFGEALAAQHRFPQAGPLLRFGSASLAAHKSLIAVPDQYRLRLAQQWLAALPPAAATAH